MRAGDMLVVPVGAAPGARVAAMQAAVKAARRARLAARQPSAPQIPLQEVKGPPSLQALRYRDLAVHLLYCETPEQIETAESTHLAQILALCISPNKASNIAAAQ